MNHSETPRAFTLFFRESVRSLTVTASLFPSSRFLAGALLRQVNFDSAAAIVELGVGTGAVTREILRRMRRRATLYAIDINPAFIHHVQGTIHDPRLVPILADARDLADILRDRGVQRADAVISSLGLSAMPPHMRAEIVHQAALHLGRRGVLTQFQYLYARRTPKWATALGIPRFYEEEFLRRYFRQVDHERVLWNLPPAAVYTCRP